MNDKYLVEVRVSEPRGESLDDWGYVGSKHFGLPSQPTDADMDTIVFNIRKMVEEYERQPRKIEVRYIPSITRYYNYFGLNMTERRIEMIGMEIDYERGK